MFNDFWSRIAEVGRSLSKVGSSADLQNIPLGELCESLLSHQGEATGQANSRAILDGYGKLPSDEKIAFFDLLVTQFGTDDKLLDIALTNHQQDPSVQTRRALHFASEPRSIELIRRLNRVPGGTTDLITMREDLLLFLKDHANLRSLDNDFEHLFASWFNRGFLELARIDWLTPARILEKVIAYEAVHKINGWSELRLRVDSPDRRLYAFFHPSLTHEPLIFVEVALIDNVPSSIESILSEDRNAVDPRHARTAVFYSISNCQKGLRGVSFGNFLIKQVVEDLRIEFSNIETFITLSPVPGLRNWIETELANGDESVLPEALKQSLKATLANTEDSQQAMQNAAELPQVVATYLLHAKNKSDLPANAVARFHLGNGARLEHIHTNADLSEAGQDNSWGVMVNYLYDLDQIEKNHEAYANEGRVSCSDTVAKIIRQ